MTAIFIGCGLVLLFAGGEFLVRGAVLVAARARVSSLMIGLTVVGFGTSTPELATSLQSALAGSPGIAIGNIVGSNIANVLLILGISALIMPIPCPLPRVMSDGALMLGASLVLAGLSLGGILGRFDGVVLVLGLAGYLWLMWRQEKATPDSGEQYNSVRAGWKFLVYELALVIGGIAAVVAGGHMLVKGAIELAAYAGISETVIGLTIVAVGTSLPELATSIVAAYRRQPEICYGNIVGSNIFNILGIAGVTAATVPVPVPDDILHFDLPVMIGVCVIMSIFAATGARLTRSEGAVMLACYGLYIVVLMP